MKGTALIAAHLVRAAELGGAGVRPSGAHTSRRCADGLRLATTPYEPADTKPDCIARSNARGTRPTSATVSRLKGGRPLRFDTISLRI